MEFRKMVTIILCTRQQKRHWYIEQSFGLCGRGRGCGDLGEWHWNMYIIYEMNCQSGFDAWYRMLGADELDDPEGWYGERCGRGVQDGEHGEGEGGMIWENGTDICILSYVKWITSPSLMDDTGCSGLVHWDDPEAWDGEGGGSGVQGGEHM